MKRLRMETNIATPDSLVLLQQMLSGTPSDHEAVAHALETHDDPRVRMIAQYMTRHSEAPVTVDAEAIADVSEEAAAARAADTRRRARGKLRRLIDELKLAQTVGDTLAAALGACYLCWGEDSFCENCAGAGRAGWSIPDRELFTEHILPAIRRLNLRFERPQSSSESLNSVPREGAGQ